MEIRKTAGLSAVTDANGFAHFLAYAEPSDGIVPSLLNTDYVSLEIELKPDAILHDPCVPLYEVDSVEYGKILVDYDESEVVKRYPKVLGTAFAKSVCDG